MAFLILFNFCKIPKTRNHSSILSRSTSSSSGRLNLGEVQPDFKTRLSAISSLISCLLTSPIPFGPLVELAAMRQTKLAYKQSICQEDLGLISFSLTSARQILSSVNFIQSSLWLEISSTTWFSAQLWQKGELSFLNTGTP